MLWWLPVVMMMDVTSSAKPNLLMIMADDLGWFDTAVYNPSSPTAHIAKLASEGYRLDHHMVFRYCSPTRRSFLSGRFPNRITTVQPDGENLCSDFLPLAATLISEKLNSTGYHCHFVGKGHLGYETTDHLPINRGFATHVGYLSGSEGYAYGSGSDNPTKGSHDMWHNNGPGIDVVPEIYYSANFYTDTATRIFQEHAEKHAADPFFMYFAIQNVHSPYTLPPSWETREYPDMWDHTYANMLAMLDGAVANLTDSLHSTGLWDNTLIVFTADNGGIDRGNNYPLRGHKHDPWEGGTRSTAFLSGGFLPSHMKGVPSGPKLVHVADWFPTFCSLAGVPASDPIVINGTAHDIDGVDVWPLLTGASSKQPRQDTPTTETSLIRTGSDGKWWKLITLAGQSNYYDKNQKKIPGTDPCLKAHQPAPPQPGRTDSIITGCVVCNATSPCLYDLLADPYEKHNVAAQNPSVVAELLPISKEYETYYITGHLNSTALSRYTKISKDHWTGYQGPCYAPK